MDSAAIRRSFTEHFVERGHLEVPSASLVPPTLDPSVLLTTAGMQPFKPFFRGDAIPPRSRLTSVQKVFRAVDIDEVGKTARHLTFFEMMGNFSFGDYFKQGAIEFAWDLSLNGWGLDRERIWVTVYRGSDEAPADDEARAIWLETGVPAERIVALGDDDNFWASGPTGPCGPCSELYFDRGAEHGCDRPDCAPGCSCDRFLEFWNLVFMQYDRAADGGLTPLPTQNIDTGAGVERVAALLQGVHSVYETDTFRDLISAVEGWTGARYENEGPEQKALRVLADHGRAMTMLATDGVMPSNESRGYILRRIIRRAVQHGSRIGLESPFLGRLQDLVVDQLGEFHPALIEHRGDVRRVLEAEEQRFAATLQTGSALLDDVIERTRAAGRASIDASEAFRLHDTYGFPVELTAELAQEAGLGLDEAGFAELMGEQRERARAASRRSGGADPERVAAFAREAGFASEFVGYRVLDVETVAGAVDDLGDGTVLVKLHSSPFYAEGGGQVSDHGTLEWEGGRAVVSSVHRYDGDQVLTVRVERGELVRGMPVRAQVELTTRVPTVANHTGTHLLHRALRGELGDHVHQRGSAVRPDKLRFDFSHDAPLSDDELQAVEDEVNRVIAEDRAVRVFETTQDEARTLGAMMLFGEKYGDIVRLVEVDGYSRELCGGTHVSSTGVVGSLRILSEGSVGQGVRRIEALTGPAASDLLRRNDRAAEAAAKAARTTVDQLPTVVAELQARVRELEKAARKSGSSNGGVDLDALAAGAVPAGALRVLAAEAPSGTDADALLELADRLKGTLGPSAVVLGASDDAGAVQFVASLTPEAVAAGLNAAVAVRAAAAIVGGGGGGRPAMARAGGNDASRLGEALEAARAALVDAG
ncbi:MAG TPA: alanine--tRNA ligase [Gaiellales bacterium]|jgi:alanyl-tRNA synthetase